MGRVFIPKEEIGGDVGEMDGGRKDDGLCWLGVEWRARRWKTWSCGCSFWTDLDGWE